MNVLLPTFVDDVTSGWPKNEDAPTVHYAPLEQLLLAQHPVDAHFTAYSRPDVPRRFTMHPAAYARCGAVPMVLMVVDVDDTVAKGQKVPAREEWRVVERQRVAALFAAEPGWFYYETRGGYRLVSVLDVPRPIADDADYRDWKTYYVCRLGRLSRLYGIVGDSACTDWTRVFRLPRVRRDGIDEVRPIAGAAGVVPYTLDPSDLDEVKRLAAADKRWARALARCSRSAREDGDDYRPIDHGADLPLLRRYAQKLIDDEPPGIAGNGGELAMFLICRTLYRALALPDDDETRAILDSYTARCEPPWENEAEVRHKIEQGRSADAIDVGSGLRGFRGWVELQKALAPASEQLKSVKLHHKEREVTDAVVAEMARHNGVYARNDQLVAVFPGELPGDKKRVKVLAKPTVRELVSACCNLEKLDQRSGRWVDANPPEWLVDQVYARFVWPGIPTLTDLVDCPVLRPDGTVLDKPGHDRATGIYYAPSFVPLPVPEAPTREEAHAAALEVLELVEQFPFAQPAHATAWLASTLTQFTRACIEGPLPLVMIDGNSRSVGKTKLADLACVISSGSPANKTPPSRDPEENRKQFTTAVLMGDTVMVLDNIVGDVGGPALDAALTNEGRWSDRILGGNTRVDKRVRMTIFATGNNLSLRDDLVRRVLYVRLNSPEERPEHRGGFRHPRLLEHALAQRPRLVRACLTVLRSYWAAGRPDMRLSDWGSYDAWSLAVRAPLVWAGLPDPELGRRLLESEVDEEPGQLANLLESLADLSKTSPAGFTAAQVSQAACEFTLDKRNQALKDALAVMCKCKPGQGPTATQVGYLLRKYNRRVCAGLVLSKHATSHNNVTSWTVSPAGSAPSV
jgi:hypothetical protein